MIKTRFGNLSDINRVLALQEKYLYRNLSEKERQYGFVTTPFTTIQLKEIIKLNGLFVTENDNNEIVAYVFAGSWEYFSQWEIFNFMVSRFPNLSFKNQGLTVQNSFQYGPICIDSAYRGKGLINIIFEEMRIKFLQNYPIGITFINKVNNVSTIAHTQKLGWKLIDEFEFNNKVYLGLAYDMTKSVLPQL